MISMKIVAFFVVFFFVSVDSQNLPDFLKICSRSNPKLNECVLNHARDALPHLLNGFKTLNVPPLNPLKITSLEVETGPNLKLSLENVTIQGFDTITVQNTETDIKNRRAGFFLHSKEMKLDGIYDIKGQVLLLPITGKGPINVKMVDADFNYTFGWDYTKKDGVDYAILKNEEFTYSTGRSYYKLENLFNGDKTLGDQMNKFLDEMWKDINKEIGPSVSATVKLIVHKIVYQIADTIPFDNIITL